ncbi:hypothetical protein MKX01_001249 [Papaver californicum]|nr:hypothetical protein MKX01_001249 [Papaver californicum]
MEIKSHRAVQLPNTTKSLLKSLKNMLQRQRLYLTAEMKICLLFYSLYKQATIGDVNTARPGMFGPKEKSKWDAWKLVEGKSTEEAMNDYITKVKQLLEEAGVSA